MLSGNGSLQQQCRRRIPTPTAALLYFTGIAKMFPKNPKVAYQQPVWRAYRASMRNLGLLDDDRALTSDGVALAKKYAAACRAKDTSGNSMLPDRLRVVTMSRPAPLPRSANVTV